MDVLRSFACLRLFTHIHLLPGSLAVSAIKRSLLVTIGSVASLGMAWAILPSSVQDIDPATLHPERSIGYFCWDGGKLHAEAFEKTAQYDALVKSGLWGYGVRVVNEMLPSFMNQVVPHASEDEVAQLAMAQEYAQAVFENGASVSITDGPESGPPSPSLTVVLHGLGEAEAQVLPLLETLGIPAEVQRKTVEGRSVQWLYIPDTPGVELAWFREAQHLVFAVGMSPAEQAINVVTGKSPSVTSSRQWKTYREAETDFEIASVGWFDFGSLKERFGEIALPVSNGGESPTINQFVEALGLQNLGTSASQFGYRGRACVARTIVEAPGKRTGLLALMDQPVFELSDIPPMPSQTSSFACFSLDLAAAWDTTLISIRKTLALLPPEASNEFEEILADLPAEIGLDLRNDVFSALGNIHCAFEDPAGGPFGLGFGLAASVRDQQRLNQTVERLLERLENELQNSDLPVPISVQRSKVAGRELITVPAGMFTPTIVIDKQWVAFSLYPQSVKAFLMRQDGELARWQPNDEHKAALAELPSKFSAITIDDPRKTLNSLYAFLPMMNSGLHTLAGGGQGTTLNAADLPPQEIVTAGLFPNVRMSVPNDAGFLFDGRQSLPVLPMPSVQSGATVPVLVALLLPAIQQAREAARRTQSQNNLRQLGLAMHNYADVYGHLPIGTVQDTTLKPEQRLSFLYSILPFIEQANLYDRLAATAKLAWDSDENSQWTDMSVPVFQHPAISNFSPNPTNYVGMAGIGEDAPQLPVGHQRAGMFGYDRKTRFRDVTDGLSNTIMMTETTDTGIPWAAGGQTLKSLTEEPYINGVDGIGGPSPGGCQVLIGDGSIRFISENIDPEVMRRLSAMADGKVIGEF